MLQRSFGCVLEEISHDLTLTSPPSLSSVSILSPSFFFSFLPRSYNMPVSTSRSNCQLILCWLSHWIISLSLSLRYVSSYICLPLSCYISFSLPFLFSFFCSLFLFLSLSASVCLCQFVSCLFILFMSCTLSLSLFLSLSFSFSLFLSLSLSFSFSLFLSPSLSLSPSLPLSLSLSISLQSFAAPLVTWMYSDLLTSVLKYT